jgi:CarD family transcriptional regulator
MSKQYSFQVGDSVVYPTHGVGKISAEENDIYGDVEVKVYVIIFESNDMTLRIPKLRASKAGLRPLCTSEFLDKALDVLSGKKIKLHKGMWSKRVQQYESKINSGDIIAIAEVIKELHSNVEKSERSYSEKIIYNDALGRLAGEYAATCKVQMNEALTKINDKLN